MLRYCCIIGVWPGMFSLMARQSTASVNICAV
jgi:hypothetical protein